MCFRNVGWTLPGSPQRVRRARERAIFLVRLPTQASLFLLGAVCVVLFCRIGCYYCKFLQIKETFDTNKWHKVCTYLSFSWAINSFIIWDGKLGGISTWGSGFTLPWSVYVHRFIKYLLKSFGGFGFTGNKLLWRRSICRKIEQNNTL